MEGVGKTACRCDSCLESCFERDRNVETHIHIYIYIYVYIQISVCVCCTFVFHWDGAIEFQG